MRANSTGDIGFVKDWRRVNVALTRARSMLVIIANARTLGAEKTIWGNLVEFYTQKGALFSGVSIKELKRDGV